MQGHTISSSIAEFTTNKTLVQISNGLGVAGFIGAYSFSNSQIRIETLNISGSASDDILRSAQIRIVSY